LGGGRLEGGRVFWALNFELEWSWGVMGMQGGVSKCSGFLSFWIFYDDVV